MHQKEMVVVRCDDRAGGAVALVGDYDTMTQSGDTPANVDDRLK